VIVLVPVRVPVEVPVDVSLGAGGVGVAVLEDVCVSLKVWLGVTVFEAVFVGVRVIVG